MQLGCDLKVGKRRWSRVFWIGMHAWLPLCWGKVGGRKSRDSRSGLEMRKVRRGSAEPGSKRLSNVCHPEIWGGRRTRRAEGAAAQTSAQIYFKKAQGLLNSELLPHLSHKAWLWREARPPVSSNHFGSSDGGSVFTAGGGKETRPIPKRKAKV